MKHDVSSLCVVHSVAGAWLPRTQAWLHHSAAHVPGWVESHVVCRWKENADDFPMADIHAFKDASVIRRAWDTLLVRFGIRNYLGFLPATANRVAADIIHSHFANHGWANLGAARVSGAMHIVNFYGYDVNKLPRDPVWKSRYVDLFAQADCFLCEGPFMGERIIALGCPREKVTIHHLGVPVEKIRFEPRIWRPGSPLRILIAAAFTEKKGIPYALEALGEIQNDTQVELTIIGDSTYGEREPEKLRIMETLDRTSLRSKARLLGFQPYDVLMREAYDHHIFLSPSVTAADGDTEGGAPVSLIEMAATGMMIVSTRHCDIPGVVLDGKTGLLAPERDVPALVSHLRYLIANPDEWSRFVVNGRKHVEQHFDAARQGLRLADIYRSIALKAKTDNRENVAGWQTSEAGVS